MRAPLISRPIPSLLLFAVASLGCDAWKDSARALDGDTRAGSGAVNRQSHATFFPIATGVHGNADCNSCHGNQSTFKEFNCLSCHEHAQQPTDKTHAGFQGYSYDSKSCLGCHPKGEGAAVNRDDHTVKFFPITAGPHGNAACASCHANPASFAEFTCLSCHDHAQAATDKTHTGFQGYSYDSKSCLGCHPKGEGAAVNRDDHTVKFFPIAAGPHGDATCASCHANPARFAEFTCLSCHEHSQPVTDPSHAGLQGYSYDSKSCLGCHPKGEGASISRVDHSSRYFPIAMGNHATATCSSCHANPANIKELTCLSCHDHSRPVTDPQHQGLAGYSYDTAACLRCHPAGASVLARADHARFFPVTNGEHALPCTSCHLNPPDYKKFECIDCHEHAKARTDDEHRGEAAGYMWNSAACYRCHPRGDD